MPDAGELTTRQAVIDFCLSLGDGAYEDYPFDDGNWTVMRHRGNKKGFAFLYEHQGRLQVNVKCEPAATGFWQERFAAVIPAYHMNKVHWNTIILDGSIPDGDIKLMLSDSFSLTRPRSKRKKSGKEKE